MKKRILALALAGTTAFSVFGAAMSASAVSSHVTHGNDAYTRYSPAEVTIAKEDVSDVHYEAKDYLYNTFTRSHKNLSEKEWNALPKTEKDALKVAANIAGATAAAGYTPLEGNSVYVYYNNGDAAYILDRNNYPAANSYEVTRVEITNDGNYYVDENGTVVYCNEDTTVNTENNKLIADVFDVIWTGSGSRGLDISNIWDTCKAWILENCGWQDLYTKVKEPMSQYQIVVQGNGTISDTVPSRKGETIDPDTVYAYDYFDTSYNVSGFVDAWNEANLVRDYSVKNDEVFVNDSVFDGKELYDIVDSLDVNDKQKTTVAGVKYDAEGKDNSQLADNYVNYAFTNYSSVRENVIDEYIDFLAELEIVTFARYGALVETGITESEFLSSYGYGYGSTTKDMYNFRALVSDIYDSVDWIIETYNNKSFINYSNSELVYLMQQFDKYADGSYVDQVDLDATNRWAELLISCLEAVSQDDFSGTSAAASYKAWKKTADAVIDDYREAATLAAKNKAVYALYDAVTAATYGRSAGFDGKDLTASLNELYFNNKSIPAIYMPAATYNNTNADLVLYGYAGYDMALNDVTEGFAYGLTDRVDYTDNYWNGGQNLIFSMSRDYGVKAVYPLYPASDFISSGSAYGAEYAGNDYNGNTIVNGVTYEYEWFANVYQLATSVLSQKSARMYQGIIDTVNDALADAVADLEVVSTPSGSLSMRLDEVVDQYDDAVETDYQTKYWDAYVKATDYADNVTGRMQTAYAIEMVTVSGNTLGYQSAQTTITKGDIANLKTEIASAQAALKALKADKENYVAAQVIALSNAIDAANNIVAIYNGSVGSTVNKAGAATKNGDKDQILRSDLENALNAIDAAINYKNVIQDWSKNDAGKWMYGTEDGYLNNGWNKIGSVWYYFDEDGTAKQSEWYKDENGKWYWFNSNAGAAIGWAKVDGEWYYFGGDNAMKTGWVKVDGNWYYLAASGKMTTGWVQVDGKWYYMSKESNSLGQMLANTTVEGYKLGADGAMIEK